ncbi:MAG: hypothetical protein MO846_07285 [Candidatus Devosia symbiotica]|nr:hypothetical protein [Candidatus Devosia symbiotica]
MTDYAGDSTAGLGAGLVAGYLPGVRSAQTLFLAIVVKGTAFTVQTSPTASTVAVARGYVEADDQQNDTSVGVLAGQQVLSSQERPITLASVIAAQGNARKSPKPAA